jgi:hypothetical protein
MVTDQIDLVFFAAGDLRNLAHDLVLLRPGDGLHLVLLEHRLLLPLLGLLVIVLLRHDLHILVSLSIGEFVVRVFN